jgi:hypothetical protein
MVEVGMIVRRGIAGINTGRVARIFDGKAEVAFSQRSGRTLFIALPIEEWVEAFPIPA